MIFRQAHDDLHLTRSQFASEFVYHVCAVFIHKYTLNRIEIDKFKYLFLAVIWKRTRDILARFSPILDLL